MFVTEQQKLITYYLKFSVNYYTIRAVIFFNYQTFKVSPKRRGQTPDISMFLNFSFIEVGIHSHFDAR